jgi:hypothetical protein
MQIRLLLLVGLPCVDAFSASASISRRLISSSSSTLGSVSSLSAHVSSSHPDQRRRRDFVIQSLTSAILALPFTAVADVVIIDPVTQLIYNEGDALPNEWHPSDHIPVAAVFSWNKVLDK